MNTELDLRFQLSLIRMMSRLTPPKPVESQASLPSEELEVLVARLQEKRSERKAQGD